MKNFGKRFPGWKLNKDVILDRLSEFKILMGKLPASAPPGSRYAQIDEYNPELGVMYFNCGGFLIQKADDKPVIKSDRHSIHKSTVTVGKKA